MLPPPLDIHWVKWVPLCSKDQYTRLSWANLASAETNWEPVLQLIREWQYYLSFSFIWHMKAEFPFFCQATPLWGCLLCNYPWFFRTELGAVIYVSFIFAFVFLLPFKYLLSWLHCFSCFACADWKEVAGSCPGPWSLRQCERWPGTRSFISLATSFFWHQSKSPETSSQPENLEEASEVGIMTVPASFCHFFAPARFPCFTQPVVGFLQY